MKPANKERASAQIPIDHDLGKLLKRLEALSLEPGFRAQREIALARALQLYVATANQLPIVALPEEVELANLYVYADFFPEDGQLDLIEQLRDMIEVHIPEEERAWLDPLHHSYMDLLEIRDIPRDDPEGTLVLRSLGDARESKVPAGQFSLSVSAGEVLLTRLIRRGERAAFTGAAVILSPTNARLILDSAHDWRRQTEVSSGSFTLGEWQEFAKRFGYVLLWKMAEARMGRLLNEEAAVNFVSSAGEPFFYALAIYEHNEWRLLAEGLANLPGFEAEKMGGSSGGKGALRRWVQREAGATVVRATLTSTQLIVECDSAQRLDSLKHGLAAAFGFGLHFKGDATAKPAHYWKWSEANLAQDNATGITVRVSSDEEQLLLTAFLEAVYLEWADQAAPALNGQTPRHVTTSADGRAKVAALLEEMQRNDLGLSRTGKPAFDYNRLRVHVGLEADRSV